MYLYPFYVYVPQMFTAEQCDNILKEGKELLAGSANTDATTFGDTTTQVRDSQVAWMLNDDLYEIIWTQVHQVNWDSGWHVDIDHAEPMQFTEYSAVGQAGEDGDGQHYDWHQDRDAKMPKTKLFNNLNPDHQRFGVMRDEDGEPIKGENGEPRLQLGYTTRPEFDGKVRKMSMSCCLSDPSDYDGGDFIIDSGQNREPDNHTIKQLSIRGSAIIFPSPLYHTVLPVTRGVRYSLVMWMLGPTWR